MLIDILTFIGGTVVIILGLIILWNIITALFSWSDFRIKYHRKNEELKKVEKELKSYKNTLIKLKNSDISEERLLTAIQQIEEVLKVPTDRYPYWCTWRDKEQHIKDIIYVAKRKDLKLK